MARGSEKRSGRKCDWRSRRLKRQGVQPGLAAVLVGDNPASQVYVRNKIKACQNLGIYSREDSPGQVRRRRRNCCARLKP